MFNKLKFLFKEPRSVQEIFDAVIDAGFYTERTEWMCSSLRAAYFNGVISVKEMEIAGCAIYEYLGGYVFLETKLYHHDLPYEFPDRLAIYRNWSNRPSFEGMRGPRSS